jgi:hypothetical protein
MLRIRYCTLAFGLAFAASAHAGQLVVSPSLVDFGSVPVVSPPVVRTTRITNYGPPTTVFGFKSHYGCLELSATAAGLPVTLFDHDTLTVQVTYAPTNLGIDICSWTLQDDNGITDLVGATAVGVGPALSVFDTLLTFADRTWGSATPETLRVDVENIGNLAIAAPHLSLQLQSGLDFKIGPITLPIPPGGTGRLALVFHPTSPGPKTDWLTISLDNDRPGGGNKVVRLTGNWVAGSTAVGDERLPSALRIEPTPTHGTIQIACALPRAGRVRVDIRDLAGRTVAHKESFAAAGGAQRIAVAGGVDWSPPPGIYMIRVMLDGEVIGRGRVVVLR